MKRIIFVVAYIALNQFSTNCYALNVLIEPEFKECASEYSRTKVLSPGCNSLWHEIESRMEMELEAQRRQEQATREEQAKQASKALDEKLVLQKRNAPAYLKTLRPVVICVYYGNALRGEPIFDDDDLEFDNESAWDAVIAEFKRRKYPVRTAFIKKQQIYIGMSACGLYASLGIPDEENNTVGAWGTHTQHVYGKNYVYTENGRVTSWQD